MFLNGAAIVAAFMREATIAYYYGASAELDAFSVAFSFVRTITELLPLTLGLAIIPLLAKGKKGESAERKAGLFGTWTFIVLSAIAVVYVLMGPLVVRVIAPGFDEKRARLAEFFIWIVSPIIIVRGMFIPIKSFANFFQRFALPEMGRVVMEQLYRYLCFCSFAIGSRAHSRGRILWEPQQELSWRPQRSEGLR